MQNTQDGTLIPTLSSGKHLSHTNKVLRRLQLPQQLQTCPQGQAILQLTTLRILMQVAIASRARGKRIRRLEPCSLLF